MNKFEEWLYEGFIRDESLTDDDSNEAFEEWLSDLDVIDWLSFVERYEALEYRDYKSLQSENTKLKEKLKADDKQIMLCDEKIQELKELVGVYDEALRDIKGYWGACGADCEHPSKLGLYEFIETALAKGQQMKEGMRDDS